MSNPNLCGGTLTRPLPQGRGVREDVATPISTAILLRHALGLFAASLFLSAFCVRARAVDDAPAPESPQVASASQEGEQAIARFQVPEGLKAELIAAEPEVANSVCFAFDGQGRVYVAETFRQARAPRTIAST